MVLFSFFFFFIVPTPSPPLRALGVKGLCFNQLSRATGGKAASMSPSDAEATRPVDMVHNPLPQVPTYSSAQFGEQTRSGAETYPTCYLSKIRR